MSSIGEQFELYSGNTPSRMNKNQFDGSINWITSGELKEHYISDTKEKISEEAAKNNSLKLLPVGTFVIAIYGLEANGVRGTCSITTRESTISQACMAFTSKMDIQNEFLYSWYKKHGNIIGIKYAQGTKQQNLSYDIIERFNISYPCMEEQKKLIRFISLIDQRIATQNKIIYKLKSLIRGIMVELQKRGLSNGTWKKVLLSNVLTERNELNKSLYPVYSVSVIQGIVNQMEYLGRSFAASDTSKYHVVHYGDLIYTKSPTGSFPYGIIKQSYNQNEVAVSPLYGVYEPKTFSTGVFLHEYFKSELNTLNYLHPLVQKGAKNTINIANQRFLESYVAIPSNANELLAISKLLCSLNTKLEFLQNILKQSQGQKQYLLRQMFI
ncbi:restriction endonuclease subunit S [Bacteroides xylanisolvens]|nr:restriction endonuclease subunit S [Bacteroides xylanisolvens]KAB6197785.1 restriction endonuclease subunit S [Bacteroides xylanisolvens]KAB6207639.1 restriction endonuclease subunit S [Bacteroides xylanisolvens]KAB6248589.1 restriction endonuclease subunit S [Bacteroides xylanisolvens]KAB6270242.1 restriction endonuclease subunit S [Bacteroides xylanisolvens]